MWTRTAFPVAGQSDGGLTICSQLYSSLEVMTTLLVLMGWKGIYRIFLNSAVCIQVTRADKCVLRCRRQLFLTEGLVAGI